MMLTMTNPVTMYERRSAWADRQEGRGTVRRLLYENGLSVVLIVLFVICLLVQTLAGWRAFNQENQDHGLKAISLNLYLETAHYWEALSENWESEFLQMAAFVWLTACFFQKGSPESKDPYKEEPEPPVTSQSPWPARRGGWMLKLYENSLTVALLSLFFISFVIHVIAGAHLYNKEQMEHGQPMVSTISYLVTSQLWFESFQNWQSEFLSIAAMVILSIFLRQKGSQESKPVPAPHSVNE